MTVRWIFSEPTHYKNFHFRFYIIYIYRYRYFTLLLINLFLSFLFTLLQLYKTVKEDPPIIKMVISGNQSCRGLSKRMEKSEHTVSEGFRQFADGSVALLFSRDLPPTPVLRTKRSEEQGRGCRLVSWRLHYWHAISLYYNIVFSSVPRNLIKRFILHILNR